jgi:hypothetical protein
MSRSLPCLQGDADFYVLEGFPFREGGIRSEDLWPESERLFWNGLRR